MDREIDVKACRMLLHEIGELCDHASLTGSLEGGAKRVAQRFNSVLNTLVKAGAVPEGLFSPLAEQSAYGEIGVEARMLASYCRNDEKAKMKEEKNVDRSVLMRLAPFVRQEELGMLIRQHRIDGAGLDMDTLTHLAPFLGQDVLSDLLRESMGKVTSQKAPPTPPAPPERPRPAPPVDFTPAQVEEPEPPEAPEPPEPEETVSDLLNLLKSPYLSEDDRDATLEKIRRLTT